MEAEGFIGRLASRNCTFMGRIFRRTQLQKKMTPQIVQKLQGEEKDTLNALVTIKEPCAIIHLPYQWQEGNSSWENEAINPEYHRRIEHMYAQNKPRKITEK